MAARPYAPALGYLSLAAAVLVAGCVEVRDRPLPFEAEIPPRLSVEVQSIGTPGQHVVAGDEVQVRVRADEPDGRLVGLGFFARISFQEEVLLEREAFFAATSDTLISFPVRVPDDLRTNTQLDFVGVAHGFGDYREISKPTVVMVVRCSDNAIFCN